MQHALAGPDEQQAHEVTEMLSPCVEGAHRVDMACADHFCHVLGDTKHCQIPTHEFGHDTNVESVKATTPT